LHLAVSIDGVITTEEPPTILHVGMARMYEGRFALPNPDTKHTRIY